MLDPEARAREASRATGPRVVVLGGGMAGIGAAHELLLAGCSVVLVEAQSALGGLAGSFERDGAFYPLGYHHILSTDRTLRRFLAVAGIADRVAWRRVRLLFHLDGSFHELGSPAGLWSFPLSAPAKLRLVAFMLYTFLRRNWSDWEGRDARSLVERWAGREVADVVFEPLARLKFRQPLASLSAAWLGARLHAREGAMPLGYTPGTNWTHLLCAGLQRELERLGCRILLGAPVRAARHEGERIVDVVLADGTSLAAEAFVSTVPIPVHRRLVPADRTPELAAIRYTALLSAVCAARGPVVPSFYWLNLSALDRTACAIFQLSALNPTIGREPETCLNFVTHLASADDALFGASDEELTERYRADARAVLGIELEPEWMHIARLRHYSPIFETGYRNPPPRSASLANLYYAGNYRTYPAVASTGTALESGVQAARCLLADLGEGSGGIPVRRRTGAPS